ncbi:hypothetical protein RM553_11675 [Zunongwangia sp. F363]|uniref:Lipoprotein n=1 Tax=Autumnicola tepida TaxID=3075595 RepID=A0ABU3CAW8_9FLAO|nr:hypothetical protein [Zunongwangia sp. F363]MDT0643492.1 hypothetical protein [Zunongwangia sp. F363]
MKRLFLLLLLFAIAGCNSAKIVNTEKPGEMSERRIEDVVIIGVTSNAPAGSFFENRLKKALQKEGVHAVPAYDSLDFSFPNIKKAEEELEISGEELWNRGFKTILISKIENVEERPNFFQFLGSIWGSNPEVREDAKIEKKSAPVEEGFNNSKIYHSNTEVYALTENGMVLIWSCSLELKNPRKFKSSVKKYIRTLIEAMEQDNILPGN